MTEISRPTRTIVNVPDGMQPVVLARLVEERLKAAPEANVAAVFVARDGRRLQRMEDILRAMLPGHTILTLPAWDCLPYDRVSPNGVTIAARMTTLSALADPATKGAIVLTAVNALIQKLPPRDVVAGMSFAARSGQVVDSEKLIVWASLNGYLRVPTVREQGEYAVRGGLVDLYPASMETPLRFDFFGKSARIDPHLRCRHASAPPGTLPADRAGADERSAAQRGDDQTLPRALHGGVRRQHGG